MQSRPEELWIRRLLEVGRALTRELDHDALLDRVLESAREITGARYAALGILNERQDGLAQFLAAGVDEDTRRSVGQPPRGRGVLGLLIATPRPLRLADVGRHPRSYGFPPGHPPMRSFLGVPVMIRGRAWGNLYMAEKAGGEFTAADEEAAVILAEWAAVAIENARLYETSERRRHEVEEALRGLEAIRDVALALGEEIALEPLLKLIVERGRTLVGARSLVIMLCDSDQLVVHASAGDVRDVRGVRLPMSGSTSGEVLEQGRPVRIADAGSCMRIAPRTFGVEDPQTALLVPMLHRGIAVGVLAAFDRDGTAGMFTEDDELTLRTFATSAATAVVLARSVLADRLRSSLAAAEAERRRWARELHDETLQGLGAVRLLLASALRRGDPERASAAMREAVGQIETEIGNLHSIITELRPAALDELGLRTAIEALIERHRERSGFRIEAVLDLPDAIAGEVRLDEEIESTTYRLVQEALSNVAKHADAGEVGVAVAASPVDVVVEVRDDGTGFDPGAPSGGYGLAGMRERASLVGGTVTVTSDATGTIVRAKLPVSADGRHARFGAAGAGGGGGQDGGEHDGGGQDGGGRDPDLRERG